MPSDPAASRAPSGLPLFWKLLAFAAAVAIGMLVADVGAILIQKVTRIRATNWDPILKTLVVLLISRVFLRAFEKESLRAIGIGFDRPWLRQLLGGLAIGAVCVGLVWGGMVALGATWKVNADLASRLPAFVLASLLVVGIAGSEELLCRGYAMQVLYRWRPWAGVLFPGLYFMAIHLPQAGGTAPVVMVNMLLAHLMYVACFLRTRSLWLGMGIHITWNFCLAFVFGMPISGLRTSISVIHTELPPSPLLGAEFGPESGLIVTGVLALAAILLWKLLPQRRPAPSLIDEEPAQAEEPAPVRPAEVPALATLSPQTSRFLGLDVLRAVSLFGILIANVGGIALHDSSILNPYACPWTDTPNLVVWTLTYALFGRKDLMLFGMMFGAGIAMVADRAAAAGRNALHLHVQRMGALLALGLVHAYLIWSGDILFTYAVCGLLVFGLRNASPKKMFAAGAGLFLVPMALLVVMQLALPALPPDSRAGILGVYHPPAEEIERHYEAFRGGWLAQMPARVQGAVMQHTVMVVAVMGWVSAGMMLVGMGLYRLGYLTGQCARSSYVRLLIWSGGIGLLLTGFGFWINYQKGWPAEFSLFIGRLPMELGGPLMALATVALVMLLFSRRAQGGLVRALAAMGQMSLTHYLSQSVILTLLFYGAGFGWVGTVDRVGQLYVVLLIWFAQLAVSPIWLSYFQFGPVEWLWRSMAYVQWQPMRRRAGVGVAVAA